jgi:hypothetical protein
VKKHQEKTARPPLELHALSGTQRALPSVLHSVAFREGGQLFTDFVNGTKRIFARFEALTVILMKILPALASRISDNPRLTSRLYTGTVRTYYTHQFFQSPRLNTVQFPQLSLLFHN